MESGCFELFGINRHMSPIPGAPKYDGGLTHFLFFFKVSEFGGLLELAEMLGALLNIGEVIVCN